MDPADPHTAVFDRAVPHNSWFGAIPLLFLCFGVGGWMSHRLRWAGPGAAGAVVPDTRSGMTVPDFVDPTSRTSSTTRRVLRWTVAVLFILAGANHFRSLRFYCRIVPPHFPSPLGLVVISGIAEMLGGAGLLFRPLRRWAGWGLIALLLAVFPANLYMAWESERFADLGLPRWAFWLRLPLQGVLMVWVWYAAGNAQRPATPVRAGGR